MIRRLLFRRNAQPLEIGIEMVGHDLTLLRNIQKSLVERIRPDRVHLNTAVRPVAEKGVEAVPPEQLAEIARRMGASCEVVAGGPAPPSGDDHVERATADVLSMLKRRPCSIPDICAGLGMTRNEAVKHVSLLQEAGVVIAERRGGQAYFCATGEAR